MAQDLPVPLVVGKEENLVSLDGPAENSAKLILLEISACSSSKKVGGIEIGIAEKVE